MAEAKYKTKLRELKVSYLKDVEGIKQNVPVYDLGVKILAEWTPNNLYSLNKFRCGHIAFDSDTVDVHLYLAKRDSMVKDANLFLEEIEERFGLPEPLTSIYGQNKYFRYKGRRLKIVMHTEKSESCRYVKTGRMVEETELVCD